MNYTCLWESMRDLLESLDKYEYEGVYEFYGSLCVSMVVYGCLRDSMDKYKYDSVHECLWEFARVYAHIA